MAAAPDFTGYATRAGVRCSDGRTITAQAFQGMDGTTVPLVWHHQHNDPANVLGHAVLHTRDDGVWMEGYFNDTPSGQNAKQLVAHKDVSNLSIFANRLIEKAKSVLHGVICEVSLVMAGANPGAFIDPLSIKHGDGGEDELEEAVIYTNAKIDDVAHASTNIPGPRKLSLDKGDMPKPSASNPDPDKDGDNDLFDPKDGGLDASTATVQQVIDTMTPEQQQAMYALVGAAASSAPAAQSSITPDGGGDPGTTEPGKDGAPVGRNVFDQTTDPATSPAAGYTLTHSDMEGIFADARKHGSLKDAVAAFVSEQGLKHGIDSIDQLFPYDQAVTDTPEFISRRMDWVAGVLGGVNKVPFARIRSWTADLTFQEARARGYVKGQLKKEQFVKIARRITTPQTVYKKQKLERDDILDITEFNVVTWLQTELRLMLDEELARAILIGDGRDDEDADKISTDNVRPIYGDEELYVTQIQVAQSDIDTSSDAIVDSVVSAMRFYRGSGNPVLYTTAVWLAKLLLAKDTLNRRLYPTKAELIAAFGGVISDIVPCEAMESKPELIGIVVNLRDYSVGSDPGGQVSMFDFFDIDYNQNKYLMECRMSGAMTKYRGALSIVTFSGVGGLLPDPTEVTFDNTTGIATVPTTSHVTYVTVDDNDTESGTISAGAQAAIDPGAYVTYRAKPASTYEFTTDNFQWTFRRDS
jgi:HK97 family phage prohead protease